MAEETNYPEPDKPSDGDGASDTEPIVLDEMDDDVNDDEGAVSGGVGDGDVDGGRVRSTMRRVNQLIPGVLTVHYIVRDVPLAMDGDAALRIIATWNARHGRFEDPLHPDHSSAINGWAGIDLQYVMGMTWVPSLGGSDTERITIDPRP